MHTAGELTADSFAITIAGRSGDVFDLFPGFDETDRIGVVVTVPHGALGASLLYLGAVHAFYELQRLKSDDFWIYPDFFMFHIGARFGHHGSLDVWPDHKEVAVVAEPDRILEAINDRAITRLVVPDQPSDESPRSREALASYRSRLRGAYEYSPAGAVAGADVVIEGDEVTEGWVRDVLDPERLAERVGSGEEATIVRAHMDEVTPETRASIALSRRALIHAGRPREAYRRIPAEDALARLVVPQGIGTAG
jgi:hypothetical protein